MHERVKTVKLHCKKGVQKKKKTKKVFFEFYEEVYFIFIYMVLRVLLSRVL
jgi:hypothetical protein